MDSPSPAYTLAIVFLLAIAAIFSASEAAIFGVNRPQFKRLAEKGSKKAQTVINLAGQTGQAGQSDKTFHTLMIIKNTANIAAVSLAVHAFASTTGLAGAAAAALVMTVLIVIFGEILPKSYGEDHSEKAAMSLSGVIQCAVILLTPVTFLSMKMNASLNSHLRGSSTVTEEDLHYLLETVEEEGVIEEQERDLVQSALEFDDIVIRDILTPRVNMLALDINDPPERIREIILEEGYSRIPVYEDSVDNIIGILFAKDYLRCLIMGTPPDLRGMLNKPFFVHRTMKLSGLLAFFKEKRQNMAIVTDDYGGALGLITTQDIIEELVGELWDEDDEEDPQGFARMGDGVCEVLGSYSLRDLAEEQEWENFDFGEDYSTVNGWAMQIFGHIPAAGETVFYENLALTVLQMDANRIDILKIVRTSDGEKKYDNGEMPDQSAEEAEDE